MKTRLAAALLLTASMACSGSMNRALRRGDLAAVQAAPAQKRERLRGRQAMRYAELLERDGQVGSAQEWWLKAYLQGADLQGLEALATSEAMQGADGLAAAHFAQILATERGAIQDRALACRLWRLRRDARLQAGLFVAAQQDQERLRFLCAWRFYQPSRPQERELLARGQELHRDPPLLQALPAAILGSFLAAPQKASPPPEFSPAARIVALLSGSSSQGPLSAKLLAQLSSAQSADKLYQAVGQDPLLGADAAASTVLLALGGHAAKLEKLRNKMRAATSLQSTASAYFRVVLALAAEGQGEESAIFWMRLGASEMPDLGQWWLWCARWAEWMGQYDAARVAHQSLERLLLAPSPASRGLSWLRLRQRLRDLQADPYLQKDAPHDQAQISVRALWQQYLASLRPSERSKLWPSLLDEAALEGVSPAQMRSWAIRLLDPAQHEALEGQIAASTALALGLERDPESYLDHPNRAIRGAAWRKLWAQQGLGPASLARNWPRFVADPVWSPAVDPLAALTVLFQRPRPAQGLD